MTNDPKKARVYIWKKEDRKSISVVDKLVRERIGKQVKVLLVV